MKQKACTQPSATADRPQVVGRADRVSPAAVAAVAPAVAAASEVEVSDLELTRAVAALLHKEDEMPRAVLAPASVLDHSLRAARPRTRSSAVRSIRSSSHAVAAVAEAMAGPVLCSDLSPK